MLRSSIILIVLLTSNLFSQFNGGKFNNVLNLGEYKTLELIPGQKVSDESKKVDDIFGSILGTPKTNENPIITVGLFMKNAGQLWNVTKVSDNEYVIFNDSYKMALSIEGSSKEENAKVIPEQYIKDAPQQVFHMIRDSVNFRYGFYLKSKHSGLTLQVDKSSKQITQTKMDYGNPFQVWAFSLRKKIRNSSSNQYIAPEKNKAILAGVKLQMTKDEKSTFNNWEFINHPTASGIYYIMNSVSKFFITVPKNSQGEIETGIGIKQLNYDKNGQLLFQFKTVSEGSNRYLISVYPDGNYSFIDMGNSLEIIQTENSKIEQQWLIEDGSFSLF